MTTDLTPGPFRTIDQMKAENARLGHHWFTPGAMRFFNSRALSGVYAGRLFVSSERYNADRPRRYTIRAVSDAGGVSTVGEFQQYSTRRRAIAAAREMGFDIDIAAPSPQGPRTLESIRTLNRIWTDAGLSLPDGADYWD